MTTAALLLAAGRTLTTVLAALGILYALLAIAAVRRFARTPLPEPADPLPPVTILKPLHGAEPGLEQNLASFARQDYLAPVQMLCGVQDPGDPAIGVVKRLAASPTRARSTLSSTPRSTGPTARSATS